MGLKHIALKEKTRILFNSVKGQYIAHKPHHEKITNNDIIEAALFLLQEHIEKETTEGLKNGERRRSNDTQESSSDRSIKTD